MKKRRWKLLEILRRTSSFFAAREMENARLEAETLLADVLGMQRLDLYLQFDRVLAESEVEAYRQHVRRRLRGVPMQYIVGTVGFRELSLEVCRDVLIPRPETEEVVAVALEHLKDMHRPRVLDLGCGAGGIALSLARECEDARVVGGDISAAALRVARRNRRRHDLNGSPVFFCGDLFAPLRGRFDAVVCNPPYVRRGDLPGLAPEVRDFEPMIALDGGEDGLEYYRRIAEEAVDYLEPGGLLILEVGRGQAAAVAQLLIEARFEILAVHPDLNRIPRVVVGRANG